MSSVALKMESFKQDNRQAAVCLKPLCLALGQCGGSVAQPLCPGPRRYHGGGVYIIDVSQSVEHDHPHALEFLRKDCANVNGEWRLGFSLVCLHLWLYALLSC